MLPLPQDESIRFLFGAEIDMDYNYVLGVSPERYDIFDFMVILLNIPLLVCYTILNLKGSDEYEN